jgi:predicted membrane protein
MSFPCYGRFRPRASATPSPIATALIRIDLFLKPSGFPIPTGVFNRTLGPLVLWGVALGLIHYKPVQEGLNSAESI